MKTTDKIKKIISQNFNSKGLLNESKIEKFEKSLEKLDPNVKARKEYGISPTRTISINLNTF